MHAIPEDEWPVDPPPGDEQDAGARSDGEPFELALGDEELLSAYLDGELPAAALSRAERLLEERPELRQLLEELQQVREALRALPRMELDAGFCQQVLHQAEYEMLCGPEEAAEPSESAESAITLPSLTLPLPHSDLPPDAARTDGVPPSAASAPAPSKPHSLAVPAPPADEPVPQGVPLATGTPLGIPPAELRWAATAEGAAPSAARRQLGRRWRWVAAVAALAAMLLLGLLTFNWLGRSEPRYLAVHVENSPDFGPGGDATIASDEQAIPERLRRANESRQLDQAAARRAARDHAREGGGSLHGRGLCRRCRRVCAGRRSGF